MRCAVNPELKVGCLVAGMIGRSASMITSPMYDY